MTQITASMVPDMSTIELRFAIKQLGGAETATRNTTAMRKRVLALLAAAKPAAPPPASRITNELSGTTPAPKKARAKRDAKPEKAKTPPKFEHDHRVLALYKIGDHIEKRDAEGRLLARVQVVKDGFEWHGETHQSLAPIAKEVSGTPQSGLVYFGVIPYNDRERKGKTTAELAKAFDEALTIYNAAAGELSMDKIKGGLVDLEASEDHAQARHVVAQLRTFAEQLGGTIRALALGANLLEVRHGRADKAAA